MHSLIRLVYASRSTFDSPTQRSAIDPGVARILAKSRRNNARLDIVGVLLFGDGFFLQCLEGDAEVVETLYRTIEADSRHRDVTVLSRSSITERSFDEWSMKYVPGEQALQELFAGNGMARFDPYRLSADQVEIAVRFMHSQMQTDDSAVDAHSAPIAVPLMATKHSHVGPRSSSSSSAVVSKGRTAHLLSPWTLAGIAVAAIGVASMASYGFFRLL